MHFERLGPYSIVRKLGKGGMGTVFAGTHVDTGEVAAVKVLSAALAQEEGFRERFEAEVESLKKLHHPNIVRLLGFGEQDGHLFYAMEIVEGRSLEEEVQAGRVFDWRETTDLALQVCRALKHAHDRGVIHRDIKPANLLLAGDGTIKLSDFGIAKLFGNSGLTADGGLLGTAEYMAPEQADGRPVTHRCDLYSLGGVLYTLLARRPPFRATSMVEMLQLQRYAEPEPLRRYASDVPVEMETIVATLLAKDPERRIPTAMVLARRLEAMKHGLSVRPEDGTASAPSDGAANDSAAPELAAGVPIKPLLSPAPLIAADYISTAPTAAADNLISSSFAVPDSDVVFRGDAVADHSAGGDGYRLADAPPSMTTPNVRKALRSDMNLAQDMATMAANTADVAVPASVSAQESPHAVASNAAEAHGPATRKPSTFTTVRAEDLARDELRDEDAAPWISAQTWVLVASMIGLGLATWWFLQPPSLDKLYARVVAAADARRLADAEDDIQAFLSRCGPSDPRGEELEELRDELEANRLQRKLEHRLRRGKSEGLSPVERDYAEALRQVELNPESGLRKLLAMVDLYRGDGDDAATQQYLELAERKAVQLRSQITRRAKAQVANVNRQLDRADELAATDIEQAEKIWQAVIELYDGRSWAREAVGRARDRLVERTAAKQ
jgi:eukaryotic-like serine/threonine-protein kinase